MIKFLLKSTNELRLETKIDVDDFHKTVTKEAESKDYILSSWSETKKERKSKGEILEEWYIVKYTLIFNDPKEPEFALDQINYSFKNKNEGEL